MNEDVRTIVYQQLSTLTDNVYYEVAPDDAILPYIVYSFPSDGRVYKNQSVSDLQIDIYDADRDGYNVSREIDNTLREVVILFDYKSFSQGESSFWMKQTSRQAIPFPEDSNMWARQLIFETRIYRS